MTEKWEINRLPESTNLMVEMEIVSDSPEGCLEGAEDLKKRYHPCGYGTGTVGDPKEREGRWVLRAHRYSSCD